MSSRAKQRRTIRRSHVDGAGTRFGFSASRYKALDAIRQANWLDGERARAWRNILLVISGLLVAAWCILSRGGLDLTGKPLGTDFISFYAASKLALIGHPAAAYNLAAHHAAETAIFHRDIGYSAFFYPPMFLLICAPLAGLPYLASLVAWLGVTGAAFLATMRAWFVRELGWPTVLAFPALLINLGHGQNALLSAALLGAGSMWLDRRPVLSGLALGLMAYKPHLGLLIPVALVAGGRWTTFVAATVTVLAFAALSLDLFGSETWRAFLFATPLARAALDQGWVEPGKMVSVFAAVRVLHGPLFVAYAAQTATILYAAGRLVQAGRSRPRGPAEAPLLIMAALLGSPFLLDYDLVALAFPLAWLANAGVRDGFRPWEKLTLLSGFVLPLVSRDLAMQLHLPIAPIVLLALFQLILTRDEARSPDAPGLDSTKPPPPSGLALGRRGGAHRDMLASAALWDQP